MEDDYSRLLTNLRILGALKQDEYIYIKMNYDIKYRYANTFITSCTNISQTWGYTHACLRKLFCNDVAKYIVYLQIIDRTRYKLNDLLSCIENSIKGLEKLKQTYAQCYSNNMDEKFDTIIDSYAKIHLQQVKDIINIYEKPKLIRQTGFYPDCVEKKSTKRN